MAVSVAGAKSLQKVWEWVCDALLRSDILLVPVVGLVLKREQDHMHNPGRNVTLALSCWYSSQRPDRSLEPPMCLRGAF